MLGMIKFVFCRKPQKRRFRHIVGEVATKGEEEAPYARVYF